MCNSRGNSVSYVDLTAKGNQTIIAGANTLAEIRNSTEIAEPSQAAFGRTEQDKNVLYVCTAGNLANPFNRVTVGGQLLAIDTNRQRKR